MSPYKGAPRDPLENKDLSFGLVGYDEPFEDGIAELGDFTQSVNGVRNGMRVL